MSKSAATPAPSGQTLTLNVGNSSLFAGVFRDGRCMKSFRLPADALVQLPARVRGSVEQAAICSVVPALTPDVLRLIRRVWKIEAGVLTAVSPHGLKIGYREPQTLGADRVAAAFGARVLFPRRNVIVVDCGTATTVTALRRDGTILGGVIFPGIDLALDSLAEGTAQLPRIAARRPRFAIGRSPSEGIASGGFYAQRGAIRETVARVRAEAFPRSEAVVVGTGGRAALFAREKLFDTIEPLLVLKGLHDFAARSTPA